VRPDDVQDTFQQGRFASEDHRLNRGHTMLLLSGLMAAVFVAKLVLAGIYYGFLTGDDLEIVESGAKYALGLQYAPWSLRCLFHPLLLVAPILRIAAPFNQTGDPLVVAWLAALPTICASTLNVWLVFRIALLFGLSRLVGILAAFFYAVHWIPLGFGAMQYPRPISTMFFPARNSGRYREARSVVPCRWPSRCRRVRRAI
jgi:hypothetical protein